MSTKTDNQKSNDAQKPRRYIEINKRPILLKMDDEYAKFGRDSRKRDQLQRDGLRSLDLHSDLIPPIYITKRVETDDGDVVYKCTARSEVRSVTVVGWADTEREALAKATKRLWEAYLITDGNDRTLNSFNNFYKPEIIKIKVTESFEGYTLTFTDHKGAIQYYSLDNASDRLRPGLDHFNVLCYAFRIHDTVLINRMKEGRYTNDEYLFHAFMNLCHSGLPPVEYYFSGGLNHNGITCTVRWRDYTANHDSKEFTIDDTVKPALRNLLSQVVAREPDLGQRLTQRWLYNNKFELQVAVREESDGYTFVLIQREINYDDPEFPPHVIRIYHRYSEVFTPGLNPLDAIILAVR